MDDLHEKMAALPLNDLGRSDGPDPHDADPDVSAAGRITRRESLKLLAAASMAAGFTWTVADVRRTSDQMHAAGRAFEPAFFTDHEYETIRVLVDMIIPADERSGSATEAGVPEFMDFMMIDRPAMQTPMRGGLAWIDYQCVTRFGTSFLESTDEQRRSLLDDIAWPAIADEKYSQGVAFFNSFRDLTASGFWSSRMGVDDLQYMGNVYLPEWTGCPPEALDHVGVRYEE